MEEQDSMRNILVTWRGKHLNVEIGSNSTFEDFGCKLQRLTNVKPETMRLLVPQSTGKGSRLITPFSDKHSSLHLEEAAIIEGKPIRMMGVFEDEIEEVNSRKPDLRIAGFDEEEKRLRQRLAGPRTSLKLPQGTYIFSDFRTLHIPGIELNPPASEALKIMHKLASDPGIVAIMNKHRWRVGIMTEMAPVGYVGISPKCILGLNVNHGEEISLRLRTDDLKGFRKYESIKQTLLHELAHMVYSEHDADFYAFNRQLNQEASSLDWTKATSHTLSGFQHADHYEEEELHVRTVSSGEKLGGQPQNLYGDARASSVAAAYQRLLNAEVNSLNMNGIDKQMRAGPDPDDSKSGHETECDQVSAGTTKTDGCHTNESSLEHGKLSRSSLGDSLLKGNRASGILMEIDRIPSHEHSSLKNFKEPHPDDSLQDHEKMVEPHATVTSAVAAECCENQSKLSDLQVLEKACEEVNAACCKREEATLMLGNSGVPDPDDSPTNEVRAKQDLDYNMGSLRHSEPATEDSDLSGMQTDEPDPDALIVHVPSNAGIAMHNHPPSSNDPELQRIQDPVADVCLRLQRAILLLKSEASPMEVTSALQTLSKIIGNVIEHPNEMKFRRLRKANNLFQKNIVNYKAAMEVLRIVGFHEDVESNEAGIAETYMVLKRNDPGLLWLAKSSLEDNV